MAEKRFEIKIGEFEEENIVDNLNRMTIREISNMCKKMNELAEENEKLEKELGSFKPIIFETENGATTLYEKRDFE